MVYRQQVTNANYPAVSGAMTQATPLIETIPYGNAPCTNCDATVVTVYDLLIAGGLEFLSQPLKHDLEWPFMYVRDQQPVIAGASYQYFVMRFNSAHEIAETIPAGTVTIPATP